MIYGRAVWLLFIDWYYSLFDVLLKQNLALWRSFSSLFSFQRSSCHRLIATTHISYQTSSILSTHFPKKLEIISIRPCISMLVTRNPQLVPQFEKIPIMLLYNINRPVEPPHNYNLKPFHNHHGNSPARFSFPGRAVSAHHKCLFKKNQKSLKKVLTTIGLVNII